MHNHGMNMKSFFEFMVHRTNIINNDFETMVSEHNTFQWEVTPSLQLEQTNYAYCVKSIPEGLVLLLKPNGYTICSKYII